MKIECLHGFFIFKETAPGQASAFAALTGLDLVRWRDNFTFEQLFSAPDYSIQGAPFMNLIATKTYAGEPWEVFRENGMIYDFGNGIVRPITSITNRASITQASNRIVSQGMILPGSILKSGRRISGYSAHYIRTEGRWVYTVVDYV